jgi:MurNAc alpha-1-phosphate uridylyltransferase
MIKQGMILAAGYGIRMRPLTLEIPKPMVKVDNISLIEHTILGFVEAGINRIVINLHYLADKLESHINTILQKRQLHNRIEVFFSHEEELLETGGGVKKALPFFENKPFFVANSDSLWIGEQKVFQELTEAFYSYNAKLILLVTDKERAIGFKSEKGDCTFVGNKLIINDKNNLAYIGLQIIDPSVIESYSLKKFSLYKIYQSLSEQQELYGLNFTGDWLHVGDIEALELANNYFQNLSL